MVGLIVETLGGVASTAARLMKFTARRAKDKKRGRDGTKYSRVRPHTDFLTHHLRAISGAAVMNNAAAIVDSIAHLKSRALAIASGDE